MGQFSRLYHLLSLLPETHFEQIAVVFTKYIAQGGSQSQKFLKFFSRYNSVLPCLLKPVEMYNSAMRLCGKMVLRKWFDKPFDRLTVLSRVEGLTTLSQPVESLKVERVEGQITMTKIQNNSSIVIHYSFTLSYLPVF